MDVAQRTLDEVRMDLDLVHRRHHFARRDQILQVVRAEVAHADGADASVREEPLSRVIGRDGPIPLVRHRLMQQIQIDRVQTELAQAGVETPAGRCRSRSR